MPAGAAPAAQDDGVQAFREREQRQREMAERDARQPQKSARPEWMVEMPDTSGGIAASIQASGAPLRARGFHQGGRVQRSGGVGPTGDTEQARRLWTETPEQRRERIMSGGGVDLPNQSTEDESERLARERATKRDSDIREKIKSMHRHKRMDELRRDKGGDRDERSLRDERSERRDAHKETRSERDERRERHERHRAERREREHDREHRSREHDREHRSREHDREHRSREHDREHRRREHDREHRGREHDREHRSREHDREHRSRDRSDRHRSDRSDRDRHHHRHARSDTRSQSPPRKTRAQREAEDLERTTTPYFDKDKVLGAGSRLMDERARARTVADAAELTSRFASGTKGAFL